MDFSFKQNGGLYFLEQDGLNLVFFNKTGLLPLKYGIYLFGNITTYRHSVKKFLRMEWNETELIEALKDSALLHFAGCFPKFGRIKNIKIVLEILVYASNHIEIFIIMLIRQIMLSLFIKNI